MSYSSADRARIEGKFDSFCKTVLKNRARDVYRKRKRRFDTEVLCDEMPISKNAKSETTEIENSKFFAFNIPVSIESDALANALRSLSERQRLIILLSYFFDMNDREISEHLQLVRSTVQKTRKQSLSEMRKQLEKQK